MGAFFVVKSLSSMVQFRTVKRFTTSDGVVALTIHRIGWLTRSWLTRLAAP